MRISDWSSDVCSSNLRHAGETDRQADRGAGGRALDNEVGEHLQQHMPGGHRDEQAQAKAERAHHERHELDRRDERDHRPGGAVRNEQRKEMQLVAPETDDQNRSEEHTSELQSLMRISYAVFCLKKKKKPNQQQPPTRRQ